MKIYELNLNSIECEYDFTEKYLSYAQRRQFFDDNEELILMCKKFFKNNNNNNNNNKEKIYVKYKNEYYFLKKEIYLADVCKKCDFVKHCENISICLTDMLFGESVYINLKKIPLYEIVFSNENTEI